MSAKEVCLSTIDGITAAVTRLLTQPKDASTSPAMLAALDAVLTQIEKNSKGRQGIEQMVAQCRAAYQLKPKAKAKEQTNEDSNNG